MGRGAGGLARRRPPASRLATGEGQVGGMQVGFQFLILVLQRLVDVDEVLDLVVGVRLVMEG